MQDLDVVFGMGDVEEQQLAARPEYPHDSLQRLAPTGLPGILWMTRLETTMSNESVANGGSRTSPVTIRTRRSTPSARELGSAAPGQFPD